MKISELIDLTKGNLLTKASTLDPDREILGGCSADLMSDVLAYIQPNAVLLTGLVNPQVIRTAQMADVAAIVFVRGKIPPDKPSCSPKRSDYHHQLPLSGHVWRTFRQTLSEWSAQPGECHPGLEIQCEI
jgi:hypothetical protein